MRRFAAGAAATLEFVDAVVVDICGTLRGKRFPVAEVPKLFAHGMPLPHSVYLMDAHGEMTNPFGRGFSDGDPDGTAWPVPGTLSRVWGAGPARAQMLMSLRDENGAADPAEPRAALERVLGALCRSRSCAGRGARAGILSDRPRASRRSRAAAAARSAKRRARERRARCSASTISTVTPASCRRSPKPRACRTCRSAPRARSMPPASSRPISSISRMRVLAADHAVFLKQIVKEAARANGFEATFMAKPYLDRVGSGLHIHVSLLDGDGRNIFAGADEQARKCCATPSAACRR